MSLILAIEPDRRQAAQLTSVIRRRVGAELILSDTTERALVAIGKRVPDLVLVQALLSPQDDATLTAALRVIAAAAHVQMLTIPVLAAGPSKARSRGLFSSLRRDKPGDASPDGCDPAVFAEQIASYLERAAEERRAVQALEVEPFAAEEQSQPIVAPPLVEAIAIPDAPPVSQVQPASILPDTIEAPAEEQAAMALVEETTLAVMDEVPGTVSEELLADDSMTRDVSLSAALEDVAFEQEPGKGLESSLEVFVAAAPDIAAAPDAPPVVAHLEMVEEQGQAILDPATIEAIAITDPPSIGEEQTASIFTDAMLAPIADQPPAPAIDETAPVAANEMPASVSHELVQGDTTTPFVDLTTTLEEIAYKPVPIDVGFGAEFDQVEPFELSVDDGHVERAEHLESSDVTDRGTPPGLGMPLGTGANWPTLQGGLAERPPEVRAAAAPQAPPVAAHPETVASADGPQPAVATAAPRPEPAGAGLPGPAKQAAEPEWVELIEALRRDIERLRAERSQPPPVASPEPSEISAPRPVPPARHRDESTPVKPKRRSKTPAIQDEWGFFDPEQCGFSALLAKLDEVTGGRDALRPKNPPD